jgi:hypothetical protein
LGVTHSGDGGWGREVGEVVILIVGIICLSTRNVVVQL